MADCNTRPASHRRHRQELRAELWRCELGDKCISKRWEVKWSSTKGEVERASLRAFLTVVDPACGLMVNNGRKWNGRAVLCCKMVQAQRC